MNYNDNITKNFKWKEFFISDTAIRLNIYNYTTDDIILNNIKDLCINILQPLRDKFGGIRITSGYRCLKLNRIIKSSDKSNHIYGYASDIEPINSNISLIELIEYIYNNLEYKELIAEYFPNGWIHVAYQKGYNNKILKYISNKKKLSNLNLNDLTTIIKTL